MVKVTGIVISVISLVKSEMFDNFEQNLEKWDRETAILNANENSLTARSRNIRSLELGFMLDQCELSNNLVHQCLRIHSVCGSDVEQLSEQLFTYSRARQLENEEDIAMSRSTEHDHADVNGKSTGPTDAKLHKKLEQMLGYVENPDSLRTIASNVHVEGAMGRSEGGDITVQNPEARCSVIRLRKWKNRCEQCLEELKRRR